MKSWAGFGPVVAASVLASAVALSGCSNAGGGSAAGKGVGSAVSATTASSEVATEATTEVFTIPPLKERYPHPTPEMPALAKEHSKEGAMAFAAYFVEAASYSLLAQDKDFFTKYCADDAKYCQEQLQSIDKAVLSNSYLKGVYMHDLVATGALVGGQKPRVEWGVQVIGFFDDYEVVVESGAETHSVNGMKFVSGVDLFWDDGWKVSEAQVFPYDQVFDD